MEMRLSPASFAMSWIFADAELSGALAGFKEGSGTEIGPIDVRLLQEPEGFVRGRQR